MSTKLKTTILVAASSFALAACGGKKNDAKTAPSNTEAAQPAQPQQPTQEECKADPEKCGVEGPVQDSAPEGAK
jgi:hypothetical protein